MLEEKLVEFALEVSLTRLLVKQLVHFGQFTWTEEFGEIHSLRRILFVILSQMMISDYPCIRIIDDDSSQLLPVKLL
jgi:hypothetical protein